MVRHIHTLLPSLSSATLLMWHLRLSHLGGASIRRLHQQGIIKVTSWDTKGLDRCTACRNGRLARRRFGSRTKYKATQQLETIHSDVCQLSRPSREGFHYFVSFIDDYSKYAVVYLISLKYQVFECFMHFTRKAERETGLKIGNLRRDNGGEYLSTQMREWCHLHGMKQVMGPPHTPELNGVVERYNQTILDRTKPSLKHSNLRNEFWPDTLEYADWKTNRSPTRTNRGFNTPIKIYEGKTPSMNHANIFGLKGIYLIPSAERKKLDNNSRE